jgi:hypothetical protein
MNRIIFLLGIALTSCSGRHTNTETTIASGDSVITGAKDSLSLPQKNGKIYKGERGFLSHYFDDTIRIKEIQEYVTRMDKYKFKDSLELENEDFMENMTDGGGSLTGYFKNGELLKIKDWVGLSYGVMQHSFYFNEGQLVFVYETEDYFYVSDSSGIDLSKFGQHFRGDYYFANNKLVDMVTLGHNRFEDENNNPEREFLKAVTEYREILLSRQKK